AQGAVFEDGVGLVRSLKQLNYSPKMLFQTSAPSNAGQYSSAVGTANTEFVAGYKAAYKNADPAEDAADAFATAQVLQTAVTKVGAIDQAKIRDWLHANEVQTILGPLSWTATGEPRGQFLLAQWQSDKVQVVGPPDLAT